MTTNFSSKGETRRLTRRQLLQLAGIGAGGTLLAACAPSATPAPTAIPATSAPPTAAAVTLRYQNHWSKETDAHYAGMQWLYSTFAAANPGIVIQDILNPDSEESRKKILADCAAGDYPDIIHEPGPDMWEAGYLTDLTPHLEAD